MRELPADLAIIAKRELNESPERISADIQAIKEWMSKEPHLHAREDDQWILTFLRGCKFSLERTKEKIDSYYTFRTLVPEFFQNRDPLSPELEALFKLGLSMPLPKPDHKGRQIYLIRPGGSNAKEHKLIDTVRAGYLIMDTSLLESDRGVIAGDVYIVDYQGMSLDHLKHLTPTLLKKIMSCYQEGYPIRPQEVHFINATPTVEGLFKLIKSFLKKKLVDRIRVYGSNLKKLHEHVSPEVLPSDYGGSLPSVAELTVIWKEKIDSHRDWFLEEKNFKTDEQKRLGKPKTTSELFGVEGSFRSLALD